MLGLNLKKMIMFIRLVCKVIEESTKYLIKMINMIKTDKRLPRIKQWDVPNSRYYKKKDFDENTLFQYHKNLKNKMIENFLDTTNDDLKLISLDNY